MEEILKPIFDCIDGDKATREFMETEIRKLAVDAERYRYLKAGGWNCPEWPPAKFPSPPWCIQVVIDHNMPCNRSIKGADLDAAIDAAQSEPQPGRE